MTIIYDFFNEFLIQTGITTVIVPSLMFMFLFYIFLLKSKIVESKFVSFSLSFLIFLLLTIFPIITGIDISIFLSSFFLQTFFVALIFVMGFLFSSIFYPNFSEILEKFQKSRTMLILAIVVIAIIFITSGALTFFLITLGGPEGLRDYYTGAGREFPREVSFTLAALILLLILAIIMSGLGRMLLKEE